MAPESQPAADRLQRPYLTGLSFPLHGSVLSDSAPQAHPHPVWPPRALGEQDLGAGAVPC